MGFLGIKSAQEKQTDALVTIFTNLCIQTVEGESDAPTVLEFSSPDSLFRYYFFCLSAAHTACAAQMKNPDAVLNDVSHRTIHVVTQEDPVRWLGGPVTQPQSFMNEASALLQDFLNRWSAYVDIAYGGNQSAATGIVAEMILSTESKSPPTEDGVARVWPLAIWIEGSLPRMREGFLSIT